MRAALVLALVLTTAAAAEPAFVAASLFPADGATDVCPDTPLKISFPSIPSLSASGAIRIVDDATGRVVERIDLKLRTAVKSIGVLPDFVYYPVLIRGNVAVVALRNGELAYGRAYQVMVEEGAFGDRSGRPSAAISSGRWRFRTKPRGPGPGTPHLVVAADGTGDFCTVQGALDFIPAGNTRRTTVTLRRGVYQEMIFLAQRDAVTIEGEDRAGCVIQYANNEIFNPAGGNPYAKGVDPSAESLSGGRIYRRGVITAHQVKDFRLANLTVRNLTPHGGGQAETVILNGGPEAHAILENLSLSSFQDTLQINGQAYARNCLVTGDVDFVWGTGPAFFEDCGFTAVNSNGYYTQVRNPGSHHGFVFLRCTFDAVPGASAEFLSRVGSGRFPHSEVVLLDAGLSPAVGPAGWLLLGGREGDPSRIEDIHFWESRSHWIGGGRIELGGRMAGSRRLEEPQDAATLARFRDPRWVLGGNWDPRPTANAGETPLGWAARLAGSQELSADLGYAAASGRNRWDYATGFLAFAEMKLAAEENDAASGRRARGLVTSLVSPAGAITGYRPEDNELDAVNSGKVLLAEFALTGSAASRLALDRLREQLLRQPRTTEGGFWHKRIYPEQMWLDGIYMAAPFCAEYGAQFADAPLQSEAVRQITLMDRHGYDPLTGLYRHGWDERRAQFWADPGTGCSPSCWARAEGWFGMALVDTLEWLPPKSDDRQRLLVILRRFAAGAVRWQDKASGLWRQVVDQGSRRGNYFEASGSSMLVYTLAKAVACGDLPAEEYEPAAARGFRGLTESLIAIDTQGQTHLEGCCQVAGLGYRSEAGYPRDGTFAYYASEPVVTDDRKAVAAFILAAIQMEQLRTLPPRRVPLAGATE